MYPCHRLPPCPSQPPVNTSRMSGLFVNKINIFCPQDYGVGEKFQRKGSTVDSGLLLEEMFS